MKTPLLLDTDIGSDIDDAVALGYLLRQPACELLGITTVTGDTVKRAALAEIICRAEGREDIPIHAGLTGPLVHGPGQPEVPQYDAVAHMPHRTDYPAGAGAVLFLRDTIRAHPGEITLFAIGPMTNIATLFALDPEIPSLLKRIVFMCGVFINGHVGAREWNALVDPIAAGIVYGAAHTAPFISVGLDVTMQCKLPADECRTRFTKAGGALGVVATMAEVWFQHSSVITFHDPLAAAWIFEPSIGKEAEGCVIVHTNNDELAGLTAWHPKAGGPHRIAADVEPQAFFTHYFQIVGG